MVNHFQLFSVLTAWIVTALPGIQAERPKPRQRGDQHQQLRDLESYESHEQMMKALNVPKEIDVEPGSTYNKKFMALMDSPCRPEFDGYFGATSGEYVRVQYGFRLEIQPLSKVMDLLDFVEDKIVDSVLMNAFPDLCGLNRRRHTEEASDKLSRGLEHVDGHPSGFRFFKFEEVDKCLPVLSEVNLCGIFTGVVYVYGKHQNGDQAALDVRSYIDKILATGKPEDIHTEMVAIEPVAEYSSISGTIDSSGSGSTSSSSQTSDDGLSRLGILLVVIGVLVFLAIAYYLYIQWSERKHGDTMFSSRQNSKRRQWIRVFKRHQRNQYKDYDPEERSIRSSLEAEEDFEEEHDEFDTIGDQHIEDVHFDPRSSGRSRSSTSGTSRSERSRSGAIRFSSSKNAASEAAMMNVNERSSRTSLDHSEDLGSNSYYEDHGKSSNVGEFI